MERVCQSCGKPLHDEEKGEYCGYCFNEGEFTFKGTLEEYIQKQVLLAMTMGVPQDEAEKNAKITIPTLKRWQDESEKPSF